MPRLHVFPNPHSILNQPPFSVKQNDTNKTQYYIVGSAGVNILPTIGAPFMITEESAVEGVAWLNGGD